MCDTEYQKRVSWFKEARFGIYVHFGLYSVLGRGEWTMYSERINPVEYAKVAEEFLPEPGCAKEWVETAKAAGANGDRSMVVDLSKTNPEGWGASFSTGRSSGVRFRVAVIWACRASKPDWKES